MIRDSETKWPVTRLAMAPLIALLPASSLATPSPQVARDCLRAAYMLYPYKRPGSAPMNGQRLFFFKNCIAKQQAGDSPVPPLESSPAPPPK